MLQYSPEHHYGNKDLEESIGKVALEVAVPETRCRIAKVLQTS
jgi:hypothetical protein